MTFDQIIALYEEALETTARNDYIAGEEKCRGIIELFNGGSVPSEKQTQNELTRIQLNTLLELAICLRHLGRAAEAKQYAEEALALSKSSGFETHQSRSLVQIAESLRYLSDYSAALDYLIEAQNISERIGDTKGDGRNFTLLGNIYESLNEFEQAISYYQRALAISEEQNDIKNIGGTLCNIGLAYWNLLDYENARQYLYRSLDVLSGTDNQHFVANVLGNIGALHTSLKEYSLAIEYFTRALAIDEMVGNRKGAAISMGNIGAVYGYTDFTARDNDKAEEYLLKSLALCEEIGAKREQYAVQLLIAEQLERTNRKAEAYDYFKRYHTLEKEILSDEAKNTALRMESEKERAIANATKRLLYNTLPPTIADRLLKDEKLIADHYESVSVLFMDIVNFTPLASRVPPKHLVHLLDNIFSNADEVMREFGLEKIKTIGDAYMAVCGAPEKRSDHAVQTALASLKLIEIMNNLSVVIPDELGDTSWLENIGEIQVRIGIHAGEVVAGVIGKKKFAYDLWGDAVNTAARMESHGEAGRIHVSEEFVNALIPPVLSGQPPFPKGADAVRGIAATPRGEIEIKGKGTMRTYFLERA